MSSPRRYTRHFLPPPGVGNLPPPGFQSVLNLLLAQRDAALGVSVPSQPIARWSSSSQPEILWELLAERRRAGIPPTLSQEQDAALEAAIAHIPVNVVNGTITTMDVTDLQRPPSERTPEEKLWDFKTRAQQYARDRESCDNVRISYLEFLETEAEDDLALARMIAG
jgi:hypothetical protein